MTRFLLLIGLFVPRAGDDMSRESPLPGEVAGLIYQLLGGVNGSESVLMSEDQVLFRELVRRISF